MSIIEKIHSKEREIRRVKLSMAEMTDERRQYAELYVEFVQQRIEDLRSIWK